MAKPRPETPSEQLPGAGAVLSPPYTEVQIRGFKNKIDAPTEQAMKSWLLSLQYATDANGIKAWKLADGAYDRELRNNMHIDGRSLSNVYIGALQMFNSGRVKDPLLDPVLNPVHNVTDFLGTLTKGQTWVRVAEFAVGGVLLFIGVNAMLNHKPATIARDIANETRIRPAREMASATNSLRAQNALKYQQTRAKKLAG